MLTACTGGTQLDYIDKSYETDTQVVNLQIPQLKGMADKEFQTTVNREIEDTCNEFLNKFKASAKDLSLPSAFSAETKKYETDGFLSLVTQIDYYTEKPHNNSFRITKNINTKTAEYVLLKDLFEDDSYIDYINQSLLKCVSSSPDKYSDLWAKPQLSENQEFYIADGNLILYFSPYELSYYSRGFVEFSIPLSSLSGYMLDGYRKNLITKQPSV